MPEESHTHDDTCWSCGMKTNVQGECLNETCARFLLPARPTPVGRGIAA
jgi:hypothetical protein